MSGSMLLSGFTGRAAVAATLAALVVPAMAPFAIAGPVAPATHASNTITDFSSAGRRHYHYGYGGRGDAAALAAFAGIEGTMGAIAASRSYGDYYGGGPAYYGGGPAYYGGGPAYYGYGGGFVGGRYLGTGPGYGYEDLGGF